MSSTKDPNLPDTNLAQTRPKYTNNTKPKNFGSDNYYDNQVKNPRSSYRLDRNQKYGDYPRDRDPRDPRDPRDRDPRDPRDREHKLNDYQYREKNYRERQQNTTRYNRDTRNFQNSKRNNVNLKPKSGEQVNEKPALSKETVGEKPAISKEAEKEVSATVSKITEKQAVEEMPGTNVKQPDNRTKPSHGHYHHKNSNKPRFAKVFTENAKEMKESRTEKEFDPGSQAADPGRQAADPGVIENKENEERVNDPSQNQEKTGKKGPDNHDQSVLIDELKVISQELNSSHQGEDVFAKLKNGETIELDNLKQLYDKIPDITKTEIISKEEDWSSSIPPADTAIQDNSTSNKIEPVSCVEDNRATAGVCCPHGNCCPPFFHHGFIPPALPHPAYYYAALWNFHHPIPPPPVQRLANAPSLPSTSENGAVHKRYITRSTKTPGSIVFTLHISDNLRIVSVRCEDEFTMTADLCNEEGEKVAENFALHNETSPKLWEQYAFSGNHTLHFNIDAPSPTVVVVTFLHEILIS